MPLSPAKIIALMDAKGISRAELARRTDIRPPHITRLLAGGETDARLSTAEKIARALGCPVGKLLD